MVATHAPAFSMCGAAMISNMAHAFSYSCRPNIFFLFAFHDRLVHDYDAENITYLPAAAMLAAAMFYWHAMPYVHTTT